jgi:hypothetical protein
MESKNGEVPSPLQAVTGINEASLLATAKSGEAAAVDTLYRAHAEDISGNHTLNHDDIRRRAYEIYLERGGLPRRELEDWLQAENELKSAALFSRATAGEKHRP